MSDDTLDAKLMADPARFAAAIVKRGEVWADLHATAQLKEETKKSQLARLKLERMQDDPKMSDAKAETLALASAEMDHHIREMVEARRQANRAKVSYDGAQALMELARSAEASRRAEMNLGSRVT